jgi:hypothetical protein
VAQARTERAGTSKLVNNPGHAVHVVIPTSAYAAFRKWCYDHSTTPSQMTRELVLNFVDSDLKEYDLVKRKKEQ